MNPLVRRGMADALTTFLSVLPLALVLGMAITESGIGNLVGWSSSSIILGGAAQLTVVSLLGVGTAAVSVAATALVVQARHLMYSAAMASAFSHQPRWFRWVGPYFLVDLIFALASIREHEDPRSFRVYYLAAGLTFWPLWQVSVAAGLVVGPVVPPAWQLGFAVPVVFLGVLVIGLDSSPKLVAAVVGGLGAYLLAGLPHRTGLLVAALAGVSAGTLAGWRRT